MPYIPEGYGELALRFSLVGDPQEMLTTIGFSNNDVGDRDFSGLVAAATKIEQEFKENVVVAAASFYAGWTFLGAKYTIVPVGATDPIVGVISDPLVGTLVGETLPVNTAILVQKFTGIGGRVGRGRMYVPCAIMSEGEVSKQGVIESGALAIIQTRFNDWMTESMAGATSPTFELLHSMVRVPDTDPPEYEIPADDPFVITSLVVDNLVATQRRRLRP